MKPNDYAKLKRLGDLLERRPLPFSNHPDAYRQYHEQRRRSAAVIILSVVGVLLLTVLFVYGLSLGEGSESVPSSVLFTGHP